MILSVILESDVGVMTPTPLACSSAFVVTIVDSDAEEEDESTDAMFAVDECDEARDDLLHRLI